MAIKNHEMTAHAPSIFRIISELEREDFQVRHFITCGLIVLLCYISMIVLPSYNADDIIQGQPVSGDANTFLSQGRWGYYLIFEKGVGANPLGPFGMTFGLILLLIANVVASRAIGLNSALEVSAYALLATVSLFFTAVFSFDSTRIAYPIAILFAVVGVAFAMSRHPIKWIFATLMLGISPAFFSASVQISATLLCLILLMRTLRGETHKLASDVGRTAAVMVVGLGLYAVSIQISPMLTGVQIGSRVSIDILQALAAYDRFFVIIGKFAFPISAALNSNAAVLTSVFLFGMAAITSVLVWFRPSSTWAWSVAALASVGLMIAPFWLSFLSPLDQFGVRALIGYATTHAGLAAVAFVVIPAHRTRLRIGLVGTVALFLLGTAVSTSQIATDEYLTSRNDILATSRLISRVDQAVAHAGLPPSGPIHLAVRFKTGMNMSPRGRHGTARQIPWSREWIFRHVDPRFVPVTGEKYGKLIEASIDRPIWPQEGAVYVEDGTVVVIVN